MLIVGPEIPVALRPFAMSVVEAIRGLQAAERPLPLFACASAEMPPAAEWAHHALKNTTLNIVAVSDGANWIRQDTGGPI
jgi:hypothetical protein